MRWLWVGLLVAHGAIHFLGTAKAFELAQIPQLTQSISRGAGVVWLLAGAALIVTGVLWVFAPRHWWMLAIPAVALSQIAILGAWTDARFGTVANVIILAAALHAFVAEGPLGLRAQYRHDVGARALPASPAPPHLAEADLAHLPAPVRRYLRASGAVGQPRVRDFVLSGHGRIRQEPDDPWMPFTFQQHNFVDGPARFFLMAARRSGIPADVLHVFVDGQATMRVRLLSLIPLVNARGPELTRAETVTLLNDFSVFAPGALVDPTIRWEAIDDRSARAHYTLGGNTVAAVLHFNDEDQLVDFVSDDRLAASDGGSFTNLRWSTPVSAYRTFGPLRLASRGVGRWHPAEGAYDYIELEFTDVRMNPGSAVGP